MKILFLDFDGVLNHVDWLSTADHAWGSMQLDPSRVALVQAIVDRTDAKIVISSTWRLYHKLDELRTFLAERGFRGEVIDRTPDLYHQKHDRVRGDEIQDWLDRHPEVESYVILDDDSDMSTVAHRLVKTTFEEGLTEADVELAVRMLETPSCRGE